MGLFKWVFECKADMDEFNQSPLFMFYDFDCKTELLKNTISVNGESLYIIQAKNINQRLFDYADYLINEGIDVAIYYPCESYTGASFEKVLYLARNFYTKRVPFFWNIADLNIFLGYYYAVLQINSSAILTNDGINAIVIALEGMQHTKAVSEMSEKMALGLGFSVEESKRIGLLSVLHDIGKLFIPNSILNKKGKLTSQERKLMEFHTLWGGLIIDILKFMDKESKEVAKKICAFHHERMDGSGYPFGLKGDEIPLEAQIVAIIDVYDALVNNRPYRSAIDKELAVSYLKANKEKFGTENINIFLSVV